VSDFGAPVAAGVNVNPAGGLKTISDLMGLQQQQQAIQSKNIGIAQQQQTLQQGAAATQMAQQSAAQRQAIAGVDWSKYDDGTGTVSTDKMMADPSLQQAAGDQFLDVIKAGAAIRGQQIQNKQSLVGLNDKLRGQFGSMVGALRTDPDVIADNPTGRQKVTDAMAQFGQAGGPDAQRVANIYGQVAVHAPPGKLAQGISTIQLQAEDASRQAATQAPTYADVGPKLTNVNPQAAGGNLGAVPAITKGVPPGMSTFQDQAGNSWAFNPQDPGHAIRVGQGGAVNTGAGTGAAAQPGETAPLKANNPGALMPGGKLAQYQTPEAGLSALDANLTKYGTEGVDTLSGVISKWAPPGENNTAAYIADAAKRLGIAPDQKIDLSNPVQRHAIATAIMLHENGPQAVFGQGAAKTAQTEQPPTLTLGEAGQVKSNVDTVTSTRTMAADSLTNHDILNRIQSLAATPGLYLGPGSQNVAELATAVSGLPGFEGAAKYANNYNELAKFMAQNAARMGKQMGLEGSDARLDLALHSQPNQQQDARTVQDVAQYMAGLTRMSLAKAGAMDKWLAEPGHSLQNEQQFEALWRENADPRLFQLAEMKDQGQAQNYAKLHIRAGEQKALQAKHAVLQSLGAL